MGVSFTGLAAALDRRVMHKYVGELQAVLGRISGGVNLYARKATELVLEGVEVVPLCVLSLKIWSQHPFGQVALGAKSCYLTKFLTGVFIIVETSFSLPLLTALRVELQT
ncbi:hypothetical protein J5N97_000837 [Dioscorea zingiberensis]|uniref:Uncharacterized protein n=1 Tax=Dioscorea zingiberensis TaxID=325984 RepID=A0A9D5BUS2_9LILI|nr:hypothetical protein J5N97_000837 [Dioscorea zingiberensis]